MSAQSLEKDNQNFLFLSCIQIASISTPSLVMGRFLLSQYGVGITISSIFIGNLILWLIGASVISITSKTHINGIQNIKNFMGSTGALAASLVLMISFLGWFAFQIDSTVNSLQHVVHPLERTVLLRIGVAIGLFSTLFSIGGIRVLKWMSVISFPCLMTYFIYALSQSKVSLDPIVWGISFPGIFTVVLSFLPGSIGLPTFFRHSISLAHSYLALTLFILFFMVLQFGSMWVQIDQAAFAPLIAKAGISPVFLPFLIIFMLLICICNNLMNVYFASACYETFSPRFYGMKGHAIIGLLGVSAYSFMQITPVISYLIDLFNLYILNLAVVLLISSLVRMVMQKKLRPLEKVTSCSAWFAGCLAGTCSKIHGAESLPHYLAFGASISVLFFLLTIFVEETVGAVQELLLRRSENK